MGTEGCAVSEPAAHRHRATTRSLSHKSSSLEFPVPRSPSVDDILSIYGVFQSQHPRRCPIPDRQARHKLRVGTSETGSKGSPLHGTGRGGAWEPRAAPYPRHPHTAIGRPQGIAPTCHPSGWGMGVHTSDTGRPRQAGVSTLSVVMGLWSGLHKPHLVVPRSALFVGSLPGSADSEEKECSWAYSPPFARRS